MNVLSVRLLCGLVGLLFLDCSVAEGSEAGSELMNDQPTPPPSTSPTQTEGMKRILAWWSSMRDVFQWPNRHESAKTEAEILTKTHFRMWDLPNYPASKNPVCCPTQWCTVYCGIPSEMFTEMKALRHIVLDGYEVSSLPASIGDSALERLSIRFGRIGTLPAEIGKVTTLTSISFAGNQLKYLPAEIGNLKNLKVLNLYHNNILALPDTIGDLTSLEYLNVSNQRNDNKLEAIPRSVGLLRNLETLRIDGCFKSVPEELGDLENLKDLRIEAELESVPASFARLTKLEYLDLGGNNLSALPLGLSALTNLEYLYLNYRNTIGKLFDMSGMPELHTAWISQDDEALTCLPPLAEGKRWTNEDRTLMVNDREIRLPTCTYPPTASPTPAPTSSPTPSPTSSPTAPTPSPTPLPTSRQTPSPTLSPTPSPTSSPTPAPTASPTPAPTQSPTDSPTGSPTDSPTQNPTDLPTQSPTDSPTQSPTTSPTQSPTASPTPAPTTSPTQSPTQSPTASPTPSPTKSPTALRLCGCAFDWMPVCGKDGKTYPNRCSADCEEIQVEYEGSCVHLPARL